MKNAFFSLLIMVISNNHSIAQTIRTVGTGGNYSTLSAACADINNGALNGNIELQIISNISETTTSTIVASGTGSTNYTSVTIYPTVANLTITGNLTRPLIFLDGADNVTFDGRVNQSGSIASLTIENTSPSTTNRTSTFFFGNSAENNVLEFCTIRGATMAGYSFGEMFYMSGVSSSGNVFTIPPSSTGTAMLEVGCMLATGNGTGTLAPNTYVTSIISSTQFTVSQIPTVALNNHQLGVLDVSQGGVINFGLSISGNGNDNNTISNCNITSSASNRPFHGITSTGCVREGITYSNDGLTIQNNNFYDLFATSTIYGRNSRNINLQSYTSNTTITGNSFYLTSDLNVGGGNAPGVTGSSYAGDGGYSCIYANIGTGNGNVTITDNYIGGTTSQCGGAQMTFNPTSIQAYQVSLINLASLGSSTGVNSSTSVIERNTIKKITMNNTTWANPSYSSLPYFTAINVGLGKCHLRENIIGSDAENASIILSNTYNPNSGSNSLAAAGIQTASCPFGGGDTEISNNIIGGIRTQNPINTSAGRAFRGIWIYSPINSPCGNNQNIYVRNNLIGSETMANSIELTTTGSQDSRGIGAYISNCNFYIDSNRVMNFTNNSTTTNGSRSLLGINCGGVDASATNNYTITSNTIKYLKSNSGQTNQTVVGIVLDRWESGVGLQTVVPTTNIISRNTIQHLNSDHPTGQVSVRGIYFALTTEAPSNPIYTQTSSIDNNFISNLTIGANSNVNSNVSGIYYELGRQNDRSSTIQTTFSNNIISLGQNVSNDCKIFGIFEDERGGATNNFYHNTINIGGVSPTNSMSKSFCIFKTLMGLSNQTTLNGVRDIRNNQFVNTRSIYGGSPNTLHYSLQLKNNQTMVNYNNHFSSTTGVGNFRAQLDVADYTDIASWTAAFTNSSEVSSLNVDPIFINANGNLPADFNKSVITNGVAISGYNLDFFSVSRNNPPQMGAIENILIDLDQDGFSTADGDCNDNDSTIYPTALEICDSIDNNCNGQIDEDLFLALYYVDADADGYGAGPEVYLCLTPQEGYSMNNEDCNDTNPSVNPNAIEIPNNGIDEDCDGLDELSSIGKITLDNVSLKPNPFNDVAIFNFSGNTNGLKLTIKSLKGEILKIIDVLGNSTEIKKENLSAGIYLVEITQQEEFVGVMRVVVY
jgi:hypothetical protein